MTKIKIRGKPHFRPYIFTLFPFSSLENASHFCPCRYIKDGIHTASKRHKLRTLKYCPLKPRGFPSFQLVMWHSNPKATKTKTNKKHRRPNKLNKEHNLAQITIDQKKKPKIINHKKPQISQHNP